MSNAIATDVITGGWAAVWETSEVTKAPVSPLGKMCHCGNIAWLCKFLVGKNMDPWTRWACALFSVFVCAVDPVGQDSAHRLTSVQAKHGWGQGQLP